MENKKVFYVVTTIPSSLHFFKGQLSYLSNDFDLVAISSDRYALEQFGNEEGIKTYCIPMKRVISLWDDFGSLIRFLVFFRRTRTDIVHGNTPKASFLSMVAAKLTGVSTRIYMCHGLRYQGYSGPMRSLLKIMERISCYCSTTVLCVSNGVKKALIADRICKASKLKVVGNGSVNGIDIEKFCRKNVPMENHSTMMKVKKEFIFCFVGRIVKDKGVNELVAAFKQLVGLYNDIKLVIVGSFEDSGNSVATITRSEIESNPNIRYLGKQKDVRPFMCMSDVFVLPSYREGFGMVLMEAGALEVPCITTDISGCNEIIQDGVNGRIIPSRNEGALYEAMRWFYEHRDDEVKEMARRARHMIIERYEQQKVWKAFLEEYHSLEK